MSSRGAHDNNYSEGVGGGGSDIVLFGVRLKVQDPIRKCVSLNDLSQYAHPHAPHSSSPAGYAPADDANRHRKRGIPWTEEEHKLFLLGLQNVGKGNWRGISNKFVKTRTPTQVASHAQKYFLRRSSLNKRRRRSSLFDITSESVDGISTNEEIMQGDSTKDTLIVHGSHQLVNNAFPFHQIATDLNSIISLDLSLSSGQNHFSPFLNNGKSIICSSVA